MTTTENSRTGEGNALRIIGFNFTFALQGGAWIRRANGENVWESFASIEKEMGHKFVDYMLNKQGWMTGCEVRVTEDDMRAIADEDND